MVQWEILQNQAQNQLWYDLPPSKEEAEEDRRVEIVMHANNLSDEKIRTIAESIIKRLNSQNVPLNGMTCNKNHIPIGISNRHIHLSQKDVDQLFGSGYELTPLKNLSQPGQFAAKEVVTIVGRKGSIHKVRVLGPVREKTQVEISRTDSYTLGIDAPIRESGDLRDAGTVFIIGPKGSIRAEQSVIIAKRHIHMHPDDAKRFGVKDKQFVSIKTIGERSATFAETLVRVSENFRLECHLDTDEANAVGLNPNDYVELLVDC